MWFGLQYLPVMSGTPAEVKIASLSFSLTIAPTASATADCGMSSSTSTPSRSIQLRAMLAPTSGFSSMSAESTSTLISGCNFAKSCTARLTATTSPGPEASAYGPVMSLNTPSRSTGDCARARRAGRSAAAPAAAVAPSNARRFNPAISFHSHCFVARVSARHRAVNEPARLANGRRDCQTDAVAWRKSMDGIAHRYATLSGVKMHYVEAGSGTPLVLLHGYTETWYEWRHVIPLLAPNFRVIAPDLRGLGDTSRPAHGYDKRTVAGD